MSNKMTYGIGTLTFIKHETYLDEAYIWATLDEDDSIVTVLNPGEPVMILSPIQVDPVFYQETSVQRTPTLYRVLTRGGVGWVSVFNILPCS